MLMYEKMAYDTSTRVTRLLLVLSVYYTCQ